MILPLVFFGNSLLRKHSSFVEHINDGVRRLVEDMIETMDSKKGVGLAAVQVGVLLRVFIIRPEIYLENGEMTLGDVQVFINSVLSAPTEEKVLMLEGCLSLPGLHREVERPVAIHVEAQNLQGEKVSADFSDFTAREIMHENDHLNGVLFIDRLDARTKREIEPFLKEIKKAHKG